MRDGTGKFSVHHKRPQKRGGSDSPFNIVRVRSELHESWTTLACHFHPDTIAVIVSRIYKILYRDEVIFFAKKKEESLVHEYSYDPNQDNLSFRRGAYVGSKKITAWNVLFNECCNDPQKIVDIINTTWLDPDYKMFFQFKEKDSQ